MTIDFETLVQIAAFVLAFGVMYLAFLSDSL
jgi:hypothetical protein